jgi:rod shape-determining protein MreC
VRNLVLFIRRYFNFLLFAAVEIFCLTMVFRKNPYQRSAFINSADVVFGGLYQEYNNVEYYFHLKVTNDSLVKENTYLRNELAGDFFRPDTALKTVNDTSNGRQYLYMPAKVVNNSVNTLVNTITIHRGKLQGVEPNMGVISTSGVVGIVTQVSDNYAVVMSLLHKDSRTSVKLSRTGDIGYVRWDGKNPSYGVLSDIPRSVKLYKGDSVVTSGFSILFPPDIPIGYVVATAHQPSSNFHIARIRYATDFYNLQYVYVIKNFSAQEQQKLESSIPHE